MSPATRVFLTRNRRNFDGYRSRCTRRGLFLGHAGPDPQIAGRGIDFGADGKTLYVIENKPGGPLSTINLITGEVTLVANTNKPAASLEWDPDTGEFLAVSGLRLYDITETGVATSPRGYFSGVCTITRDPLTDIWYTIYGSVLYTFDPDLPTAPKVFHPFSTV